MKTVIGTLGNKVGVKSYIANLAGHVSNQIRLNIESTEGEKTQIKLDKKEALELLSELKQQIKNLN
jgi:hypothetical protein